MTGETYDRENPKQVYYLSMEFLIGRSLANNIINLDGRAARPRGAAARAGSTGTSWSRRSPTPAWATAASGRLAACFIDSLATLQIPAIGYGLRYEYGIFRQEIERRLPGRASRQLAAPARPVGSRPARRDRATSGSTARFEFEGRAARRRCRTAPTTLLGMPYDRPVVGYGGRTINTLRLWGAAAPE